MLEKQENVSNLNAPIRSRETQKTWNLCKNSSFMFFIFLKFNFHRILEYTNLDYAEAFANKGKRCETVFH